MLMAAPLIFAAMTDTQGMHHSVGDALRCPERHLLGFGDLLIPSWMQSPNLGAALSPFGMLLAAVGAPDEQQKLGELGFGGNQVGFHLLAVLPPDRNCHQPFDAHLRFPP